MTAATPLLRIAGVSAAALALVGTAGSAEGAARTSIDVKARFAKQVAAIDRGTAVPILLPRTLPGDESIRTLYIVGHGHPERWSLTIAATPTCGTATACFVASFAGRRGGLLEESNLHLAGGQRARYVPSRCGASCGPATLRFVDHGVLYDWRIKRPPDGGAKALAGLASTAIARR